MKTEKNVPTKTSFKKLHESFVELKETIRSQGCTSDVFDQLERLDKDFEDTAKKLKELLEGEQTNYDTALAMKDSFYRDELLSRSWGRITLLQQLLEALEP